MSLDQFVTVKKTVQTGIRINCYLAILKQMKHRYPQAHFEVVVRKPHNSVLSPSKSLLAKIKTNKITFTWKQYEQQFEWEIFNCRAAINRMRILRDLSTKKQVFLVCYEKDPTHCHRRLLKQYIEHLGHYLEKWFS